MRTSETGRPLAAWAWQDLPNLFSLLVFFSVTAVIFRSVEFALVVTSSLGFHEIGHVAALSWFGLRWQIAFGVVGAWTTSPGDERAKLTHLANSWIHLAGPLFSLLLAFLALVLHQAFRPENQRLLILASFSAQVGLLNLLPLGPLTDGGKVVRRMMASLDHRHRWLAVFLPMAVSALVLLVYGLLEMREETGQQPASILLGLLLVGLWLACSLFFEARQTGGTLQAALPGSRAMPSHQAFLLILMMWVALVLLLFITAVTPFWLDAEYIRGYLENMFAVFQWMAKIISVSL